MMQVISSQRLAEYLRSLEIEEEGTQAINESFPYGYQKASLRRLIQRRIEAGHEPKRAVWLLWESFWRAMKEQKQPLGPKPTEKDFSKL